jgi:hypothetical protein
MGGIGWSPSGFFYISQVRMVKATTECWGTDLFQEAILWRFDWSWHLCGGDRKRLHDSEVLKIKDQEILTCRKKKASQNDERFMSDNHHNHLICGSRWNSQGQFDPSPHGVESFCRWRSKVYGICSIIGKARSVVCGRQIVVVNGMFNASSTINSRAPNWRTVSVPL